MGVAEAAVAALRDDDALALFGQVGDHVSPSSSKTWVPAGTFSTDVGAASAGAVAAHAVHAGLGLEMLLIAEVDQRVEAATAHSTDDVAAACRRRRRPGRRTR